MKTESLIFIIIVFCLIQYSCGSNHAETESNKNCLTEKMEQTMTIDSAVYTNVENELKLTGKVTFDEEKVIKVVPFVSGTVTEVKAGIGDHVEKGQVIAVIKSSEMAGVSNDLNTAQSDYEIALKNFNVMEDMHNSGIASEKEYITAQNELQKAKSSLEKAKNISSIYGEKGKTFYYVKAPISGVIVDKQVNPNMQIRTDNNDNLFTISDLKDVWVMANVFETDISKVKQGYNVDVSTLSYPDQVIPGKIDRVYDVLDPVTKVMKARIKLDNNKFQLKPGMFANVVLHSKDNAMKLTVPSKAIIFDNSTYYVIVYRGKCAVEARGVKIYKSVNNKTYIDDGLKAGDKIIVNNNLLIYDQLTD